MRSPSITCACEQCGAIFHPAPSLVAKGGGRFCSVGCQGLSRRLSPSAAWKSIVRRFWANVQKAEGCWLWTAGTQYGYGRFHGGGKTLLAPRISWEIHFGPIPDGLCVLHHCDNPPCVRPDHLFLGTKAANARDRVQRGREPDRRGEKHPRAKLTEIQVLEIRRRYAGGETIRALSDAFARPYTTISAVVHRVSWQHI